MTDRSVDEVVAHFDSEKKFKAAVEAALDAGFARDDLSVLATHDSLEVAEAAHSPLSHWLAALTGEVKYLGPLATAGLIALASGPTGLFLSGLVAAGVAGFAAKEFLDDLTAADRADAFARAVEAGGIVLWIRVGDESDADRARAVLAKAGGDDVHLHSRITEKDQ